jgi:hypothetical protein
MRNNTNKYYLPTLARRSPFLLPTFKSGDVSSSDLALGMADKLARTFLLAK